MPIHYEIHYSFVLGCRIAEGGERSKYLCYSLRGLDDRGKFVFKAGTVIKPRTPWKESRIVMSFHFIHGRTCN